MDDTLTTRCKEESDSERDERLRRSQRKEIYDGMQWIFDCKDQNEPKSSRYITRYLAGQWIYFML